MTTVHEFENGLLISESIIDNGLERTKGRVTREEHKELAMVADRIRKERDGLKMKIKYMRGGEK